MRIQETVRKPMTEAKYLNVDNTDSNIHAAEEITLRP